MLKELLLYMHIFAGFSSLVAALIAAFNKIFDLTHSWHVYSGRVFFAGMIIIFLTAVPIALMTGDFFLLLVAIFSVYLALSGWSYARNRQGTPAFLDWLRSFGMAAASVVMALYGAGLLISGDTNGVTMLVFSSIGGSLSISDLKIQYAGGVTGKERVIRHLTMMLAGLIATVTAFLVVNFTFDPVFVLWLAPTVLITPVIVIWSIKIEKDAVPRGMPQDNT